MSTLLFVALVAFSVGARAEIPHAGAPAILGGRTLRRALDPDPSAEVQAYCNDSLGQTCKNAVTPAETEAFNHPMQEAATDALFHDLQAENPDLTREALSRSLTFDPQRNFDDWLSLYIRFQRKLEDELRRRAGGLDLQAMFEGEIKSAQIAAIQSHGSLSEDLRTRMIDAVSRTRFYTPSQYLQSVQTTAQRQRFVKSFMATCGPMGLSDNAFSFQAGDGRPYPGVVVCPGSWTKGLAVHQKTGVSVHDHFVFTLGHELGHNIDSQKFRDAYHSLVDCFSRNGQSNGLDESQLPEITADYWAAETRARLQPGVSGTALVRATEGTFADNCNSDGNEEHPPGDFRIRFMARNPRELERMGCSVPNRRHPSCAVEGQVPPEDDGRVAMLKQKLKTTHPNQPGSGFFDAAEELLDRLPPQQAFAFARELRSDDARRALRDLFNARYVIDPAFLRRIVYDSDSDPLLREAARRELARGTNEDGVRFLYDSFGNRPELALIFDRRLRHALQRGDERNLAQVLAFLVASIGRDQKIKLSDQVRQQLDVLEKAKGDPTRRNLLLHLEWALRDALKQAPPATPAEKTFRDLFSPAYAKLRLEGNATWERVDRAAGGDEVARGELLHDLDPECALDLMASLLGGPYENLVVKLARVFARRSRDGALTLELTVRYLGERGTQAVNLGRTDDEIRQRLRDFQLHHDLRRYTLAETEPTRP